MSEVAKERRKAVADAWKLEKARVQEGTGTRDWSQKEQREIIATGKAKGYQGHHMKSVDGHNSKAGDANNIQFLTRKEHLDAHNGNFRNNTNGYYDPTSGKTTEFGRYKANVESKALSQPLNESQKKYADKKAEKIKEEKRKSAKENRDTRKHEMTKTKESSHTPEKHPTKKSEKAVESKTLAKQHAERATHTPTQSKTLSVQRAEASLKAHTKSNSNAQGHTSSGGKSASHSRG